MKRLFTATILLLLLLAGCAPATPNLAPAPTQASLVTPLPTNTDTPVPIETATPVLTDTPPPAPTNTPLPSPTDTPRPAATPTPALPAGDVEVLLLLSHRYGANYYLNRDNYEQFGWHVTTTAVEKSVPACAPGTTSVRVHRLLSEIGDVAEYDVVAIMPASKFGTQPFVDLLDSPEAMDLIRAAAAESMPIYASCSGVRLLAAAGILEGRQVIGEPRFKDEYEAAGATYIEGQPPPVIDGNIVTARRGLYYHLDNGDAVAIALEALYPEGRQTGAAATSQKQDAATSTQAFAFEQEGATWTRTFGGPSAEGGRAVQQTSDGGFVIGGYTYSFGSGEADVYLVKTDAEGNVQWARAFGGPGWEYGFSVTEMQDGGFAVTGYTTSYGAGSRDVYLIRTDAQGDEVWSRTFGGPGVDVGQAVSETGDGGLILVGYTDSFGAGENDVYLIRTNAQGQEIWSKTFGGEGPERGDAVSATSDGGFVLVGATGSFGAGNRDVYLIKTDAEGNELWSKTYGYGGRVEAYDWGHEVQDTSDGGYIVVGDSNAPAVTGATELMNVYLVKTDAEGNEEWSQGLGTGSHYDYGNSVREMEDGGYVAVGAAYRMGRNDVYAVKVDAGGNWVWSRTFGDLRAEWGSAVTVTDDGGIVIVGHTDSFGAGSFDVWLLRVDG